MFKLLYNIQRWQFTFNFSKQFLFAWVPTRITDSLEQGCPSYGPRAAVRETILCGPQSQNNKCKSSAELIIDNCGVEIRQ